MAVVLLFALQVPVSAFADNNPAKGFIIIGTGAVTGVYYPAGGAICFFMNQARKTHGVRCSVESTGGSISNLDGIRNQDLDIGIVQSDWQYQDVKGLGPFLKKGKDNHLRSLFSLYPEPLTIVVRTDSGIKSFYGLLGKRVNIGNPGSGQRATFEVLMKLLGWKKNMFKQVFEMTAGDQSRALCNNRIDAMIYMAGLPSGAIKEATTTCSTRILSIPEKVVARLIRKYPYYQKAVIPGGMFAGNPADIHTFGVAATVVTSDRLPDKLAYQLVKGVFDNFTAFKRMHPAFEHLDKNKMVRNSLVAPLDSGALRYFKEVGLIR